MNINKTTILKQTILKIISSILALCIVLLINFILPRAMPGDSVLMLTGMDERGISTEQYNIYKEILGLNKSISQQFSDYIYDILKGDLGYSYHAKEKVSTLIFARIPNTLMIAIPAFFISTFLALILGISMGYKNNSKKEKLTTWILLIINSMPSFLIGMILVWLFGFKFKIFPLGGLSGTIINSGIGAFIWDRLIHLVLPISMLVLITLPSKYLLLKSSTADFKDNKAIIYAKSRGISTNRIKYIHIFKNAGQPFISATGMNIGTIISGSMICETIFSIKGMGQLMHQSIMLRDLPTLQGCLTITAVWVVAITILTDIFLALQNPKVRCKSYDRT